MRRMAVLGVGIVIGANNAARSDYLIKGPVTQQSGSRGARMPTHRMKLRRDEWGTRQDGGLGSWHRNWRKSGGSIRLLDVAPVGRAS